KHTDACVEDFLKGDVKSLFGNLKQLSNTVFTNFKPMIPAEFHKLWKHGIDTNDYYLKLCGSGGGGYFLGFTQDIDKARKALKGYKLEVVDKCYEFYMMIISRRQKLLLLKFLSLFSVIRGYNVLVIALAQYLTSLYILAPDSSITAILFDPYLFCIVAASAIAIASGYIINSFYDSVKDLINRPHITLFDSIISQRFIFTSYFVLNFVSVIFASYVSFRAVVFFSSYIFGIWFYSHKLKRVTFLGNLVSATLAIAPFFAVFVYYKNFQLVIFVHPLFLFFIRLLSELLLDQ